MRKFVAFLILSFSTLVFTVSGAAAPLAGDLEDITVRWDPNTNPDHSHYIVSHGRTRGGPYANSYTIDAVSFTFTSLAEGDHYVVIRSVDSTGNESSDSTEIKFQVGEVVTPTPSPTPEPTPTATPVATPSPHPTEKPKETPEPKPTKPPGPGLEDEDSFSSVSVQDFSSPRDGLSDWIFQGSLFASKKRSRRGTRLPLTSDESIVIFHSDNNPPQEISDPPKPAYLLGSFAEESGSLLNFIRALRRKLMWQPFDLYSSETVASEAALGRVGDYIVGPCDLDGDGNSERLVIKRNGKAAARSQDESTSIKFKVSSLRLTELVSITCGDLIDDKADELVIVTKSNRVSSRKHLRIVNRSGRVREKFSLPRKAEAVVVGDWNEDKEQDLIVSLRRGRKTLLQVYSKTGEKIATINHPRVFQLSTGRALDESGVPQSGLVLRTKNDLSFLPLGKGESFTVLQGEDVGNMRLLETVSWYKVGSLQRRDVQE